MGTWGLCQAAETKASAQSTQRGTDGQIKPLFRFHPAPSISSCAPVCISYYCEHCVCDSVLRLCRHLHRSWKLIYPRPGRRGKFATAACVPQVRRRPTMQPRPQHLHPPPPTPPPPTPTFYDFTHRQQPGAFGHLRFWLRW